MWKNLLNSLFHIHHRPPHVQEYTCSIRIRHPSFSPDRGVAGNTIWIFQQAEGGWQWWIVPLRAAQVLGLLPAAWSLTIWLLSRRTTQSMFGININRVEWPPPPAPQLAGHGWSHTSLRPTFTMQPREDREQSAAEQWQRQQQQQPGIISPFPQGGVAHRARDHPPFHPSIHLSVHPFVKSPSHLLICPSAHHPSPHICICLTIHLSLHASISSSSIHPSLSKHMSNIWSMGRFRPSKRVSSVCEMILQMQKEIKKNYKK